MSREATSAIAERARTDSDFRERLDAEMAGKEGKGAQQAFLAFARANGFEIEPAEAAAIVGLAGAPDDAALDSVSGGVGYEVERYPYGLWQ